MALLTPPPGGLGGPGDLPVHEVLGALTDAVAERGVAVLVAPPGAGKTTVVPLALADGERDGRVLVLEPRRLAARAAARRMADTLGEAVGTTVGYVTGEDRCTSGTVRVEVVTEGILTRRIQRDPMLRGVTCVVFDELHERHLHSDLGLALALDLRRRLRPDLVLVAMSATIDSDAVAALLGDGGPPAPVVRSDGRLHPVAVRWAPGAPRDRLEIAVAAAVQRALREEAGDVLVFLPGAAEIDRVQRALDGAIDGTDVDLLRLHGTLAVEDQDRALAPSPPGRRRVVLSTDIAESSLTVAGVRIVVDAGLSRRPRHDPGTGMTRLVTGPASKASADQRAGRAGRTGPGAAYRVWSMLEHATRPPFHRPEILEVDLAGLALDLAARPGGAGPLRWLDPPPAAALAEAGALLAVLGAVATGPAGEPVLTATGRAMLELPLHPRLACMVATAPPDDAPTACALAALLDERDVLVGPRDQVPVDLALRLELVADPARGHPGLSTGALRRVRRRAGQLAGRAGLPDGPIRPARAGALAALAFPDRIALARGGPGRFTLRSGPEALVRPGDPLAGADALVVADLDGARRGARVRLAAALDPLDLLDALGDAVEERTTLVWDRGREDLVLRTEARVDALHLGTSERRPDPGPATTAALLERVRATRLGALGSSAGGPGPQARDAGPARPASGGSGTRAKKGTGKKKGKGGAGRAGAAHRPGTDPSSARAQPAGPLRARVAYLRARTPADWPDWSDPALLTDLDDWLGPYLAGARGRADLEALDLDRILAARLTPAQRAALARDAPARLTLPSGRSMLLRYGPDGVRAAVRVADLFGVSVHPQVGGEPVILELLSPADRPLQITTDLPGFWAGSWAQVRTELLGRYPKHVWPTDPGRR